jgi:hypothetical protein
MDKLFIKGLNTTFLTITLKAAKEFNVSLSSSHLDSSSMHVHGEYNSSLPEVIFENQQAVNVRIQVFDWGIREGINKSQEWADIASRKKVIALLP